MIKFLTRARQNFVELIRIKSLLDNKIISSAMGRAIEGAVFSLYAGAITYLIQIINTGDVSKLKATLYVLGAGFAKTILETILKAIRDHDAKE